MRKKIFTFLLALAASVGMSWATDPIVIATNTGQSSYTQGSITVSVNYVGDSDGFRLNSSNSASISNSGSSTISKIELVPGWFKNKHNNVRANGAAPNSSSEELITFLNVNSNEVTLSCSVSICIKEVRIYFEEPSLAVAYTLQLHVNDALMGSLALQNPSNDIVDNGDGTYTVPEGAEVTLQATPNEGYEFIGWKASSSICDFNDCEFIALSTVANPLTFDMNNEVAFMAEFAAVAPQPQPQIGPKEVLDLGTTGCVGEHYQLTGGGTNIYRTVGGVDDKMITIESLHGEIIDNISLKLYYYNVWIGYSVAASSGDVSSWNYDAYEDLVITNINATSVTLSRVGSGQANGYVMFEKVTINNSDEPQPQPAEDVDITPNVDPENPTFYYSTFFDSSVKYELPENVEAYIVTTVSGDAMQLQKVAEAGQTIPAGAGVILKSRVNGFTLEVSDADAVSVEGNRLQGSDISIATPANCYVLSCKNDLVGFYHYNGANLNPHKAYIIYAPNSGNQAPQRLRFVFDQATGVENVQGNVQSTKVIENGVLYIIKNGAKYNAQGQVVK